MTRPLAPLLTAALALAIASGASAAPRGVRGVVRTLLRPVAGVHVVIPDAGRFALTDSLGRYDLGVLPPGLYSVTLAAVGYESTGGTVTVQPDSTAAEAEWLLKPLRPEGEGGLFPHIPPPGPSPLLTPGQVPTPGTTGVRDSALADSLMRLPSPGPIVPEVGLFLTPEEEAAHASFPGPLGELLPQIATADSITFESGGTGAPGFESWRQWSERLALQAAGEDDLAVTARRALAYTRTRAALAAGPNWIGWQASKTARAAIAGARQDTRAGKPGTAFLDALTSRLDAVFVSGQEPARPKVVRHKVVRSKKKRAHRR